MKRQVRFTEQVARFRDHYMPATDRETFMRLVDRIAADPEGGGSYLAFTTDTVTREVWDNHIMINYVVTSFFLVIIDADIYDASRGFNEV
ncbi:MULTISPECIES: hypothetical protein [unclassified Streptomyces]|uniref:hypothetical protein n=1 Tax=unclassified Streptomyces TaxID=2593676 RepID=UPI00255529D4|nr:MULTISPECIES: hypothetical protein [unclassified Streptomyces]WRZ62437.1 hypothetical protein OG408_00395 [Streptomyces sp. NBC_01257]WSU56407.1 hypothetical protein OG450_00435 [Streptomyces sp. NBC_01104]